MSDEDNTVQINLVIPTKMKKWLDEHRNINRSELFRQAVKRKMNTVEKKVPPLFFLASIMGVMLGVVLVLLGIAPSPLNKYIRALLSLIGGILAFLTTILYRKESKSLQQGEEIDARI